MDAVFPIASPPGRTLSPLPCFSLSSLVLFPHSMISKVVLSCSYLRETTDIYASAILCLVSIEGVQTTWTLSFLFCVRLFLLPLFYFRLICFWFAVAVILWHFFACSPLLSHVVFIYLPLSWPIFHFRNTTLALKSRTNSGKQTMRLCHFIKKSYKWLFLDVLIAGNFSTHSVFMKFQVFRHFSNNPSVRCLHFHLYRNMKVLK